MSLWISFAAVGDSIVSKLGSNSWDLCIDRNQLFGTYLIFCLRLPNKLMKISCSSQSVTKEVVVVLVRLELCESADLLGIFFFVEISSWLIASWESRQMLKKKDRLKNRGKVISSVVDEVDWVCWHWFFILVEFVLAFGFNRCFLWKFLMQSWALKLLKCSRLFILRVSTMIGWRITCLRGLSEETTRCFVFHLIESSSCDRVVRLKKSMFDCNQFVKKFYAFSYYSCFRWPSITAIHYTKSFETVHPLVSLMSPVVERIASLL